MFQLSAREVMCPYCGETIEIFIDPSVATQRYIEDCQVCCRPMTVHVAFDAEGDPLVQVHHEDA